MVNDTQRMNYYKKRKMIRQIVLQRLAKTGNVLTGQRAMNRVMPDYLDKVTKDYDILVGRGMTPQQAAMATEARLDKHMGFNAFETVGGDYEGVRKVRSRVTESTIADYTQPEKMPTYKKDIDGVNIVGLKYLKKKFKEAIANPEAKFRHAKDKESLNRIRLYEQERNPKRFDMFNIAPVKKAKPLKKVKNKKVRKGGWNIW